MACFLVPTTEAIVTTIVKKTTDKKKLIIPLSKDLTGSIICFGAARLSWRSSMFGTARSCRGRRF